jgi:dynein light chain LC8-type
MSEGAESIVKIHKAEIPDDIRDEAIKSVQTELAKGIIEKDIATNVKKFCDDKFTGTWHVVIGRNFGCSITHDTKYVLFFMVDLMHVLIFKSLD